MFQIESKDLLRNIFSSSSDGIACSDLTGDILFANKSFTELEGIYDYISFASVSCNKAKSLIDELSEYSGIKQINNNLRIIRKEQIDLSGQVN